MTSDADECPWTLEGRPLRFEAKLIDVESGHTIAVVDVVTTIEMESRFGGLTVTSPYSRPVDSPYLRRAVLGSVMTRLAASISKILRR